jgi:hypothetical protein
MTSPSPSPPGARTDIPGWGADLDHANRPAYPKERTPPRLEGLHWAHPPQQPVRMTVFHSTERSGITPVFGTSVPPRGLSGWLRAQAYRQSENDVRHWLMLMLADRVNMLEGVAQDLVQGHVPNVFAEMGGPAELRHNPRGFARKGLIAGSALLMGLYLLRGRRRSR